MIIYHVLATPAISSRSPVPTAISSFWFSISLRSGASKSVPWYPRSRPSLVDNHRRFPRQSALDQGARRPEPLRQAPLPRFLLLRLRRSRSPQRHEVQPPHYRHPQTPRPRFVAQHLRSAPLVSDSPRLRFCQLRNDIQRLHAQTALAHRSLRVHGRRLLLARIQLLIPLILRTLALSLRSRNK